jgi:topoisomerase-4 subunit A
MPSGASFTDVIMGVDEQKVLMGTDAGYGFITTVGNLFTKNKAGKAVVSIPKSARILRPKLVNQMDSFIAAVSNEGRMLVFPISDIPELARGKGNKIINIPTSRLQSREEYVVDYAVIAEGEALVVYSGKRYHVIKLKDLEHYRGERGRRGHKLPRGFQKVDRLDVDSTI